MSPSPLRPIHSQLRRFRRFVVADRSMEPTLVDGQGLVARASETAHPGQLRCLEHPTRPGFWMVKRVESVTGRTMRVMSDNLDLETVDSRRFGPVPIAGSYRVIVKIPKRLM